MQHLFVFVQGVPRSLRRKLTALISRSMQMTTSPGCICVLCVTNGLRLEDSWQSTVRDIPETTFIHVLGVRNVIRIVATCIVIWIFIERNTSVQNVADAVRVMESWPNTCEPTRERDRFCALFVANSSNCPWTLLGTTEYTLATDVSSVRYVTWRIYRQYTFTNTWERMRMRHWNELVTQAAR